MAKSDQSNADPYYLGEKTVQKGKKAGIKQPLLFLIASDVATAIGLPKVSGFPQTIGGIKYEIKNRVLFAEGTRTTATGKTTFNRLVRVKRGSKAVKLYLSTDGAYTYTQQGKTVTGRRPDSVQVGVPSPATAKQVHDFFAKAVNVQSFSMGGGIYPINKVAK
jgi:hypothetical protein